MFAIKASNISSQSAHWLRDIWNDSAISPDVGKVSSLHLVPTLSSERGIARLIHQTRRSGFFPSQKIAPGNFVEAKASHQIRTILHFLMNGCDPFIRKWRRARDSNPRYGSPYTPLAGVRLQPLGQLSRFQFVSLTNIYAYGIMAHVHVTSGVLPSALWARFARAKSLPAILYCGLPALSPLGSLRSCKIAPGDFVSHSASSPDFSLSRSRAFMLTKAWRTCALLRVTHFVERMQLSKGDY